MKSNTAVPRSHNYCSALERREEGAQVVVVELVHEGEQGAQLAFREAFAGHPAQVVARQLSQLAALVFPVGHFTDKEEGECFGMHGLLRRSQNSSASACIFRNKELGDTAWR
jgi:hypothetical protein